VDARTRVRELASTFRTRIERKRIGVRDEAKRLDGVGRCGRQYCSASWLPELRPVNLGVAKMLYSVPSLAEIVPYWLAVAAGALSGLAVNFSLNYTFNFRFNGRPIGAQLRTFIVVALGGGVLMVLIANSLVWFAGLIGVTAPLHVAGLSLQIGFIAHVIATGVLTFYSFAAHSLFSFNVGLRARLKRAFSATA
jgi:putative flippase GtrA